jgi:hypothetical protein
MILITGDVHNKSLGGNHQDYLKISELKAAIKYAEIASNYGIKVTLFIAGKVCLEEPEELKSLYSMSNVEIGAHTWDCRQKKRTHRFLKAIFGSLYGPKFLQINDVAKTIKAFYKTLGFRPIAWRGHAFYADQHTYQILAKYGFRYCSNNLSNNGKVYKALPGLLEIPINTPPDHDSIFHGEITKEFIKRRDLDFNNNKKNFKKNLRSVLFLNDPIKNKMEIFAHKLIDFRLKHFRLVHEIHFPISVLNSIKRVNPEEWLNQLIMLIPEKLAKKELVTVLAHPICMELADGMKIFKQICKFASNHKTGFISDIKGEYRNN